MSCCPSYFTLQLLSMEPGSIEDLCLLYQSPDFLVVNKHWDIRIDSKMWYEKLTVQRQLKHRFPELADPDTYYGFRSATILSIFFILLKVCSSVISFWESWVATNRSAVNSPTMIVTQLS